MPLGIERGVPGDGYLIIAVVSIPLAIFIYSPIEEGVFGSVYAGVEARLYREGILFSDIKGLLLAARAGSAVCVIGKGDVDRLGRGVLRAALGGLLCIADGRVFIFILGRVVLRCVF